MPLILTNRHERLILKFPAQPTEIQNLWPAVKAEVLSERTTLSPMLKRLEDLIGTVQPDEHTTIYFHRLTFSEQQEVNATATERGQLNFADLWMETCKRAVDGWDNLYDADLRLVPVPTAATEQEQRAKIAAIVEALPSNARQTIANEALKDTPDFLLQRWSEHYLASSASPIGAPGTSSPVSIADGNGLTTASLSRVTGEA